MADCTSVMTEDRQLLQGNQRRRTLEATDSFTGDTQRLVSYLGSAVSKLDIGTASEVEESLAAAQDVILVWDNDASRIWDCDPEEAFKYLRAVEEVQRLIASLEAFDWTKDSQLENDLLCRAHNILQMAMTKLEEEFVNLLLQYNQLSESDRLSFRSSEEFVDDFSSSSFGEDMINRRSHRDNINDMEDSIMDLIIPSAHPDIKCIAELMFLSHYDKECCQAYVAVRKDILDECLSYLRVEKLSIEEVLQMDWKSSLYGRISKWNKAMKIFVRVYLVSEKNLCDHIFRDLSEAASRDCFFESVKGSLFQLLNFGEAIAVGSSSPEKLFRVLDMYEAIADLVPDIEALFQEGSDACILTECNEVMSGLGDFARASWSELKHAIQSDVSTQALVGGGTHPLTKYVMNYLMVVPDYSKTLDVILEGVESQKLVEETSEENSSDFSPVARDLLSVTLILESNLESKSKLYQDVALQHFFMMNNLYYMVKKVKDSDLQAILGDDWIRAHIKKYMSHAVSYERVSWNPVLLNLRDEGIKTTGSSSPSKTVLKERLKSFNIAFEDVYKSQTAWNVPHPDLREDLRISISLKLLQAYRTFVGRYGGHLDGVRHKERYIRFSYEELENYILDLFEGTPKSFCHIFRR